MAKVAGVINTAINAGTGPNPGTGLNTWQTQGYIRGQVQSYTDYYVALGSEATGSVIKMHPLLEAGLMILYHIFTVVVSTGSLTMSIGDLDSVTRYANASTNAATAGAYLVGTNLSSTGPYIIGTNPSTGGNWAPTTTDTDAQIVLTTGGATLGSTNIFALTTCYTAD